MRCCTRPTAAQSNALRPVPNSSALPYRAPSPPAQLYAQNVFGCMNQCVAARSPPKAPSLGSVREEALHTNDDRDRLTLLPTPSPLQDHHE